MNRGIWLVCVLGTIAAWGQTSPSSPDQKLERSSSSAEVPMDAAVLTIKGFCPKQNGQSGKASDKSSCETVITRAQFEQLASAIRPNASASVKQQLASLYPRMLVMSERAEELGLEKLPPYEQMIAFSRMQILSQGLTRRLQQQATVSDQEISNYYHVHGADFEEYTLERLFIPLRKQTADAKNQGAGEMRVGRMELEELAESLQKRAAAEEDLLQLQKEAFAQAGITVAAPSVNMGKVRRSALPAGQAAILELKPGQVSEVISDAGGHYIYKLDAKTQISFDQAESEIRHALENQRAQDELDKIQHSYSTEMNQAYFAVRGSTTDDQ